MPPPDHSSLFLCMMIIKMVNILPDNSYCHSVLNDLVKKKKSNFNPNVKWQQQFKSKYLGNQQLL